VRRICAAVDGPKMHNNNSAALVVAPARLAQLGFHGLAIYPDLLLSASIEAMSAGAPMGVPRQARAVCGKC
jgi:hypothetical protein